MPFLWAKVLIFQGSAHQNSVGSLSKEKYKKVCEFIELQERE